MRLVDRSGGFFTNLIIKKVNPDLVITQSFIPDELLMKKIGDEAISSIKGSVKHKFVVRRQNGKLVFNTFPSGSYLFGIQKRISPDGTPFQPLSKATMAIRQWKAEKGQITFRGAAFILRETSRHIMEGLRIKYLSKSPRGGKRVEIGWTGENERIANLQNDGSAENKNPAIHSDKDAPIPARPFRGFSEEFRENFFSILRDIQVL